VRKRSESPDIAAQLAGKLQSRQRPPSAEAPHRRALVATRATIGERNADAHSKGRLFPREHPFVSTSAVIVRD
jgi:hypothetical protein